MKIKILDNLSNKQLQLLREINIVIENREYDYDEIYYISDRIKNEVELIDDEENGKYNSIINEYSEITEILVKIGNALYESKLSDKEVFIIGYYDQAFFGGGTYYKLSKKENENKLKMEYSHSVVPNDIPKAEKYIKIFDTLKIEDERFKEYFEGKIKVDYFPKNMKIEKLLEYITKCNWKKISKKKYSNDDIDDGTCWKFYIEYKNIKYFISGYEDIPNEIENIVNILKKLANTYLDEIMPNEKDIEIINKNKKNNISVMTFLKNKGIINNKTLKAFKEKYKE